MSRIGKAPVKLPKGVDVTIKDNLVKVKGPKGELSYQAEKNFKLEIKDGVLTVVRPSDSKNDRSMHGLIRTMVNNMVVGVSDGYEKALEIVGVGYRVAKQGDAVNLTVGYSHPIVVEPEKGIEFDVPNANTVVVKGIDKYKVGQTAANLRKIRPPEPYKGKGIKYADEVIRRKVGKAGA